MIELAQGNYSLQEETFLSMHRMKANASEISRNPKNQIKTVMCARKKDDQRTEWELKLKT